MPAQAQLARARRVRDSENSKRSLRKTWVNGQKRSAVRGWTGRGWSRRP